MSTIYKNGVPYLGITQAQDMSVQVGNNTLNLQSTIQNILGDFAPIESNPVSKAYSVGQYLIFNGNLYKVTTNIAQGGTLVVGTNVQATTVNNELTSLGGAAYQNVANNLTTTTEGSVLDARQGKALNDSVTALNSKTESLLLTEDRTSSATSCSANSNADFSISISKSGYTPIGIVSISKAGASNGNLAVSGFRFDSSTAIISVRNVSSTALSGITTTVKVLYRKN